MLDKIKDQTTRSQLFSNVFYHLRNAESRFFENEICIKAMETAMFEIDYVDNTQTSEMEAPPPVIEKEKTRQWIRSTIFPTYYIALTDLDQIIMILINSRDSAFPFKRVS